MCLYREPAETGAQMSLDMVDLPEAVHHVQAEITKLWIGIVEALLRLIPPFFALVTALE